MSLAAVFIQTLDTTLPVFAMVFLGVTFKRLGWIDEHFIDTTSTLLFRGSMPTLVFISIVRADLATALLPGLILFFMLATIASFGAAWAWAAWRIPRAERGIYTQGVFRGNCGIVGLALVANMYGNFGLSAGSILFGLVILIYNSLSVVVLSWYAPGQRTSARTVGRAIIGNPLIISTGLALPVAAFDIPLPHWAMTSASYFARLSLPLALICIGGTLSLAALRESRAVAASAATAKMVVLPVLATAAAWLCGFHGRQLGLLFIYFGCPTAANSFVMVQAMGGNARLAANIVAATTLGASVTITAGVFALRALNLI